MPRRHRLERLVDHDGTEVGTADAHGHDVLDALTRDALPCAGTNLLGKGVHAVEHLVHVGHDILAVDDERALLARGTAKRGVQHGAVLGCVDVDAREHLVTALLDAHGAAKVGEKLHGLVGDEVLREVEVEVARLEGELVHAVGVRGEPILKADPLLFQAVVMLLERLPFRCLDCVDRRGDRCHSFLLVCGRSARMRGHSLF